MKTRLNVSLATAGIALVLLTGCVSSKKYKASQAALQQLRDDSTRLAQQAASLNQNVNSLQEKNTTLQRSMDSISTNCATQQKSLAYYQNYFTQQQGTMSQVSEDLKSALSQAGVANADIQQTNGVVYVRLNENDIFKKNSTVVSTTGKQALSSLAQAIKSRSDVNVMVSGDDSASSQSTATGDMSSSTGDNTTVRENANANATTADQPVRHRTTRHATAARKSTKSATAKQSDDSGATSAQTQSTAKNNTSGTHKKVHRKYSSEGGVTYYNTGSKMPRSKSWALKQGRINAVANNFLESGVPKVNVTMEKPANGSQPSSNIKVVIVPTMTDFNPQSSSMNTESK